MRERNSDYMFARFVSYVFHPLLLPSYAILLFTLLSPELFWGITSQLKYTLVVFVFVFTFLLPVLNIFFLYKFKLIQSFQLNSQNERRFPYLITCIFYIALYYLIYDKFIPDTFKLLLLIATISLLLTTLLNLVYKISAHMAGIGSFCGALMMLGISTPYIPLPLILVSFIIAGVVGYARLTLESHTGFEIYSGFIAGFISNLVFLL